MRALSLSARRFSVLVALALCTLVGGVPLRAQTPGGDSFDIRDQEALAAGAGLAPAKSALPKVAAQVVDGLANLRSPEGLPVTYSVGRFGLPKRLSVRDGSLSAPRPGVAAGERALEFLRTHQAVFPFSAEEIAALRPAREDDAGGLRVVRYDQTVQGVPVYGGRISVAVDGSGRVIQVTTGDALPGLRLGPAPTLDAAAAVQTVLDSAGPAQAEGLHAALTEAVVFPTASGEGRHAWRIFMEGPRNSWEMVVDAADGRLLRRVGLARRAASARVWTNHPPEPREVVEFPAGWLPEGGTLTRGNNIDAFVDGNSDGEPDPVTGDGLVNGRAASDDSQFFDHPAGDGYTFDVKHFAAAATNAFYFGNIAHDYFYAMGFQEGEGAFQLVNGPGGGKAGDPVKISVQDLTEVNNAAFIPSPDGTPGRMLMGALIVGDQILDTSYDGDSVVHEYTHGVTERLVGGPDVVGCLAVDPQGEAMSEGLSDYYAASFFDDPILFEYGGGPETGARRNALDNNPRKYEDLGLPYFEAHGDGEILSAVLWKIREGLGQEKADDLVLNALKMLPCAPDFLDLRDALLDVDAARNRGANRGKIWMAFAEKGMGVSARGSNYDGGVYTLFDSAPDLPDDLTTAKNHPPRFLGTPSDPAIAGEAFQYVARFEDPDGDPVVLKLLEGPNGATFDAATGRLSYRGTFTSARVSIEATDSKGARTVHGLLVFSYAILTQGRPLAISGTPYSRGVGLMIVDGQKAALQATMRGGQGDPNMIVIPPVGFPLSGAQPGSSETVTVPNPPYPAIWGFRVDGGSAYSNVNLIVDYPKINDAALDSQLPPLTGARSSEVFYKITIPAGTPHLRIAARGGTGDADLLLAKGRLPVCETVFGLHLCDNDVRTSVLGNFDKLEVAMPAAGDWFLTVKGFRDYRDVVVSLSPMQSTTKLSGVTDAAAFGPIMPSGGIGTLFGEGFTEETLSASSLPLPTNLGGVTVYVEGVKAGLFFVSPTQINFQIPTEAGIGLVDVVVATDEEVSNRMISAALPQVPETFTFPYSDGALAPVVIHADGSVVTPDNPAKAGEILVAFLNGAALNPQPADGEAAAADPLSLTADPAEVMVGGSAAETLFSGATPGFVGLIQVNFQMPDPLPAGDRLPLEIHFGEESTTARPLAVMQ
ncbi:MAG: hypothetical protein GC160_20310 [Acidobacteria bacterium]|nr:hypothetical protein [Acidobacteriota bacterium]